MSAHFKHYVITRFNIPLHWPEEDLVDNVWTAHRFDVFERICLPSVAGQTNQDFTWLVLFSAETAKRYKRKIAAIGKEVRVFSPVFLPTTHSRKSRHYLVSRRYWEIIKATGHPDDRHVISTRLDNDDALHKDFVCAVQDSFVPSPRSFVNFPNGYLYDVEANEVHRSRATDCTNTLSLIERTGRQSVPKTVYFYDHHRNAADFAPVRNVEDLPAWLIAIHARNIMNRMHMYPVVGGPLDPEAVDLFGNFGVRIPTRSRLRRRARSSSSETSIL